MTLHPTHDWDQIDAMDFLCAMCDTRPHWESAGEPCIGWLAMTEM